ncbi:hypothetical protein Tsubulata_044248, partial [Turnera subulata]
MAGRWSDLPRDLLERIGNCLQNDYLDILRFRAVCSSWRRYSSTDPLPPMIPSLTLPPLVYLNDSYQYVLKELAVYSVQPAHLPGTVTTPLVLSQSLKSQTDEVMILKALNSPLCIKHKGLVFDLRDFRVKEMWSDYCLVPSVLVSSSRTLPPSEVAVSSSFRNICDNDGFTVMAVIRPCSSLFVWTARDEGWTIINDPRFMFDKVTYLNDKFYALDGRSSVARPPWLLVVLKSQRNTAGGRIFQASSWRRSGVASNTATSTFFVFGPFAALGGGNIHPLLSLPRSDPSVPSLPLSTETTLTSMYSKSWLFIPPNLLVFPTPRRCF